MARKRMPGQYVTTFKTEVTEPSAKKAETSDGRPLHEWHETEGFYQTVIYNGNLQRHDGVWKLALEWIDLDLKAHKVVLPHKVVMAIERGMNSIMAKANSDRAIKAAETRKEKGIVPFESKSKTA
jgi:hypothetical protein